MLKAKSNVTTSGKQPVYPWAVFLWAPRFLSIPWCPSTLGCHVYFHLSFPQTEFLEGRDCLMCLRSAAGALWALLRASGSPLFACPGWARPRVHLSHRYCYHVRCTDEKLRLGRVRTFALRRGWVPLVLDPHALHAPGVEIQTRGSGGPKCSTGARQGLPMGRGRCPQCQPGAK